MINGMDKVTLVFEPAQEGGFSAYVAEVPGANSQGETMEEARAMVLEALHDLLEYRREKARAKVTAVFEQVALA
jgi:predicted RNase H-like HicB family nuclease